MIIDKKCENCGKSFTKKKKPGRQQKYCSDKCRYDFAYKIKQAKYKGKGKKWPSNYKTVEKTMRCVVCEQEFKTTHKKKYCGDTCKGADAGYMLVVAIPRNCRYCFTLFTPPNRNFKAEYCSKQCRDVFSSRKRRKRIKESGHEKLYEKGIFERDEWRCQSCGCSTPEKLRGSHSGDAPELDHIMPLALGGAHEIDNLQCLCRDCNLLKGAKHPADFKEEYHGKPCST